MEYNLDMTTKADKTYVDIFFALVNAEVRLWDKLDAALKQADLSLSLARFLALYHLSEQPLRLQDLAHRCLAKESAASRLAERMYRDGLIAKSSDAQDGRAVMLHLTPKGQQLEKRALEVFHSHLKTIFEDYGTKELKTSLELLSPLLEAGNHD